MRIHSKEVCREEAVYDVVYNIDINGLRNVPSSNNDSSDCLLFFGGSFTFGEGLNDDETLPYFVGNELDGKYKILNFGFHGYGTHQMLAAIEAGTIRRLTKSCSNIVAIYSAIPNHIARAAGCSPWDKHGPNYVLSNGTVTRNGSFDDEKSYFLTKSKNQLYKSYLLKHFFSKEKRTKTTNYEKNKFIQMIKKTANLLKTRFIIVFWDANNLSDDTQKNESAIAIKMIKKENFEYYLVGDILEKYRGDRLRYGISKYDLHPNAYANKLLAKYLASKIKNKTN
jgi:hypothetical protein